MSRENVELVRLASEAWNERGPESIKEFWAEDGEWHDPPNLPDSRVVRGRDAIAAYLTEQARVVGGMKTILVDVRARDETVVIRVELTLPCQPVTQTGPREEIQCVGPRKFV
jgi:ketosteroid isomerase-like protein